MAQLVASRPLLVAIPGIRATTAEGESPLDLGSNVPLLLAAQLHGSVIVRTTTAGPTLLLGAPLATTTAMAATELPQALLVLVVLLHGRAKLLLPLLRAVVMVVTLAILGTISLAMALQLQHLLASATSFNSTVSKLRHLLLPTSLRHLRTTRRHLLLHLGMSLRHHLLHEA
jgi:hypothetical protein